jgi:hypothetical protein
MRRRVIIVDDLCEQVGGAVGAGEAARPLFGVVVPGDRLAGVDAKHWALQVDDLWFAALDRRLLASTLGERGHALGSSDLAARSPELDVNHLAA